MAFNRFNNHFQTQKSGTQYRHLWQVLHIDILLLLPLLGLLILGSFVLYSANIDQTNSIWPLINRVLFGFIVMFVLAQIPPAIYARLTPGLLIFTVFLLIAVLIAGHINKGAQRWLHIGLLRFQPSELMKVFLPMMLAWYYQNRNLPPKLKDVAIACVIILVPAFLVIKEPDLGTGLLLIIVGFGTLMLAGLRWIFVFLGACLISAITPVAWHFMHTYQKLRILTFLNPERDPLGTGYHIIQSKIAVGSGGFLGKGFLQGTQSHLNFLPEHTTDFIFAVLGEEFGFWGSFILLTLYGLLIARCISIAYQAQDTYTRLLAGSLSLMLFFSVFINIGMVSGILPVVGVPLPIVSYGNSAFVTLMAAFGILMSIQGHRTLLSK